MEVIENAVVYIDGVDVTPWIIGPVLWEPMKSEDKLVDAPSCKLMLDNANDAFTITPGNVCAGMAVPEAWAPQERAKYQLYCAKLALSKKKVGHYSWYYTLTPHTPVLSKYDRIDVYRERTAPPLLSYHVDNYSMVDDAISGKRYIEVRGRED